MLRVLGREKMEPPADVEHGLARTVSEMKKQNGRNERVCDILKTGIRVFCAISVLFVCAAAVRAQDQRDRQSLSMPTSELGRENLSRVAASASELKTILVKDTGLMVELKRWVAKDATSHGQIIGDFDLSDDAIFDRLQSDVQFRSVATMLVQRYGYLVPQVNPDSIEGKEQEQLAKERAKWMVQNEDEELTKGRQRKTRNTQNTVYCNAPDAQCADQQGLDEEQAPGQQSEPEFDSSGPTLDGGFP